MNGKSKCRILKNIRRKIAEDNDIVYAISECKYQGECSGTCPKCEAEVRYLEEELSKRKNMGKSVAIAGIAAAMVVGSAGCSSVTYNQTGGTPMPVERPSFQSEPTTTEPTTTETVDDDIPELAGVPAEEDLMGDVAVDSQWPW